MLVPSRDEFLANAHPGCTIPIFREILADFETPLSAYWKLASEETFSFLLESVTGGEQLARYSILGVRPKTVLRSKGRAIRKISDGQAKVWSLADDEDPLNALQDELPPAPKDTPGLPKFIGGAIGLLGYDIVRFIERLPGTPADDLEVDDMAMMLADAVVVFDHAKNLIKVIVLAEPTDHGYSRAAAEIDRIEALLKAPLPPLPTGAFEEKPVSSNTDPSHFEASVQKAIDYIGAGDCIQVVLSQRFETSIDAHPLTVYRALRSLNPSPYMFLLRFGDLDIVGASPELLVSLSGRTARVRPIAGTRWRGRDEVEDEALAQELLADEKERAEHIMLVDLGRNDIGKVSEYGTVSVNELMVIERYSHVMHIVSDVTGRLRPDLNAFDLLRASFPAGTVSGAPKVRAMEIIDEMEPTRRGVYAGAVGYFSANGDMDLAIAIRTITMTGGKAYVQAGAGIVFDSNPAKEFEETRNKAMASLRALALAQAGLES